MTHHFSSPSHPLIHAFLLRREEFQNTERLIVETREQGEKLFQTLQTLSELEKNTKQYRLITTKNDILEVLHDPDLVGIFPIETLDWRIDDESRLMLVVTKGMTYSEEKLVTWLTDHGFKAAKSDEENTFFRQGDTVSIQTRKGTLLVNFFGTTLETLYLDGVEKDTWKFFSCLQV
mgnify:CR=1 FL=1